MGRFATSGINNLPFTLSGLGLGKLSRSEQLDIIRRVVPAGCRHKRPEIYPAGNPSLGFTATQRQEGLVGQCGVLLEPLVAVMRRAILQESYLQADETPVPVLAPGNGKTKIGYLWAYRRGRMSDTLRLVRPTFAVRD